MPNIDISRDATDYRKHYDRVHMQQGRVLTDDDFNEAERLDAEDARRVRVDMIGPAGSPDDGFKLKVPSAGPLAGQLSLSAGTFYVGGLRLELESDEAFSLQKDWLQQGSSPGETLTPPSGAERFDFVWLDVWQQPVSAVEDKELLEAALCGADTSARIRTMRRAKALTGVGNVDCAQAWTQLLTSLNSQGTLNGDFELVPNASLKVEPDGATVTDDLCSPPVNGGYLGAENQAIRVQITGNNQFTWGFDNAAPLYRVQVLPDKDGVRRRIKMLTRPKDQAHYPLEGQVVELLPWSALLSNGQKNAELSGFMAKVNGGYNPDMKELFIDTPLQPSDPLFETWNARTDKAAISNEVPPEEAVYFYMRVWNRGDDTTSPAVIGFVPGDPEPLEKTGLQVTFSGTSLRKNDFWIIAVRPETRDKFVPWELRNGRAPHGLRRWIAPLGIIHWPGGGAPVEVLDDCRPVFDPLTALRGCCIEVKPGDDIHRALKKIFDAGGGCLCLLPGDHVLRQPIDLTGRSSIHIGGFGIASRLNVSSQISAEAPFILRNAQDISFKSFVVVNQAPLPLCVCGNTVNLNIERVFALTNLDRRDQPVFSLQGPCYSWRLENNVFVGNVGIIGRLLALSAILDNVWIGTRRGIELIYAQELQIERNDFLGIHGDLNNLSALPRAMMTGVTSMSSGKAFTHGILNTPNAAVASSYIGIQINGAFDVDIIDNEFYGAVGLYLEWTENGLVQRNRFRTLVVAALCGIAHGFRFDENRIGVAADDKMAQKPLTCEAGLVLRADAIECRIADNVFANVKQGVVFESDFGNEKAIVRDFSANLHMLAEVTDATARKALQEAEVRTKEIADKNLLLRSTFFRVGRSERVVIQGNQFHATETGIEWSGTTQILDFRVVGNAFIGCQDVAVQIEPDPRILMLADPVDTKVRLIENNRFEIYSGAVRATIGAVRVEKNDIRIDAPTFKALPPKEVLTVAANRVYNSPAMARAAQADDMPLVSMMAMEATSRVEMNPGVVNAPGFAKDADDKILKTYQAKKGDALADRVLVMKTLAELGENKYLGTLGNMLLPKWTFNSEGFVINLAGIQNRVVHNRLYGNNPQRPDGVLFNAVSGEVRDNEIVVPGTALLLNGKLGLASGYQGAEVVGNTLVSVGVAGSKITVYALAIPSLSPGNLAINSNLFNGSVMIGGDPLSALGFSKPGVFVFPGTFTFYNAMKFDSGTYAVATLSKAFPFKPGNFGVFKPPGIVIPIWQTDPHANRPIVQFCQNRLIRGWVGIFQALSGAYWSAALLKSQASEALIANVTNNVLDYGGSVVGHDLVIVGNHSQAALKYRVGGQVQAVANIPSAMSF